MANRPDWTGHGWTDRRGWGPYQTGKTKTISLWENDNIPSTVGDIDMVRFERLW